MSRYSSVRQQPFSDESQTKAGQRRKLRSVAARLAGWTFGWEKPFRCSRFLLSASTTFRCPGPPRLTTPPWKRVGPKRGEPWAKCTAPSGSAFPRAPPAVVAQLKRERVSCTVLGTAAAGKEGRFETDAASSAPRERNTAYSKYSGGL